MEVGEIYKYIPTSTVGKVTGIRESDGKVWAFLDFTQLWYDAAFLQPADVSEYKEISYKEKERSSKDALKALEKEMKDAEDVDISQLAATGGG